MKKLILVMIALGLFAVSGCAGGGNNSASMGVNLQGQEFSNLNE